VSAHKSEKKKKGKGKGKEDKPVLPPPGPAPKFALKDRAHGPDWSAWDINDNSFKKTKGKGFKQGDFAFMKLTDGEIDDAQEVSDVWVFKKEADIRAEQWMFVKDAEIRGAFHYMRSGQPWQAQADHFLQVVEKEGYDFHIYALDVEGKNNTFSDEFFADARRIIDHWRVQKPPKMVMLYCNPSTFDDHIHPKIQELFPVDGLKWIENVPLWLAQYDPEDKFPTGEAEPKTPKNGTNWDIWQYSQVGARGKAEYQARMLEAGLPDLSLSVDFYGARDLNVFRGSKEAMREWLGISSEPQG